MTALFVWIIFLHILGVIHNMKDDSGTGQLAVLINAGTIVMLVVAMIRQWSF